MSDSREVPVNGSELMETVDTKTVQFAYMRKISRPTLQRLRLTLKTSAVLKAGLFFVGVVMVSTLVVYLAERRTNDGFVSFFDSFWWTIVTISTVGYGERVPSTVTGRLLAIGTILFGMGIMGTVTGRIASILMERQMKEENGLLDYSRLKGHFIICGWKREMNQVLYEILESNPDVDPLEVVLLTRAGKEDVRTVRNDPRLKGIKYINGDFMEERDLRRAGVVEASKILVLADSLLEGDLQQIDSKTVMAVMSIKNLNKRAYVCAELLDVKFEKYLRLSHCDEILLSREFSRSILASAASGAGLSHIVAELVSRSKDIRIDTTPIPDTFTGKTYGELRGEFGGRAETQLIGLLENTGNLMIRKQEAIREAQKNPDISSLIPTLREAKNLTANAPVINPPSDYAIRQYTRAIVIVGSSVHQTKGKAA